MSDDAISRQVVIDTVESWLSCDDYNEAERHIMRAVQSVLYDLPPVKPQEPCDDAISRQAALDCITATKLKVFDFVLHARAEIRKLPSVIPQSKTGQYEKHIDHTDCIWYGNDGGCPVTCSQYRDGWNDAMDYIFKNGKGYQPYRHDG